MSRQFLLQTQRQHLTPHPCRLSVGTCIPELPLRVVARHHQLTYVNRRSVRRLDFVQKTINAAFSPCMALLAGRGGPDGQAVVRRTRDPNASSGQRQVTSLML